MVWTPEPWQGLLIVIIGGGVMIVLGLIPFLPGYKRVRKDDPTPWVSYVGRIVIGIIMIILGLMRFLG